MMVRKKAAAMVLAIMMAVCGLPETAWAEKEKIDRRETFWQEEEAEKQAGDLTEEPGGEQTEDSGGIEQSGSCGENATYTLDAAGTLTISGSGDIRDYAFTFLNQEIKEVRFGKGITGIGECAFENCSHLTIYCYAGSYAETYAKENRISCHTTVLPSETPSESPSGDPSEKPSETPGQTLTDNVRIQDGKNTYEIKDGKTAVCTGTMKRRAKTVKIPDYITVDGKRYPVTAVADKAFQNTNVTGITLGGNLKSIGESAFAGCRNLKKVTIKGNLAKIGKKAFVGCKKLKVVAIKSKKLKAVGKNAFQGIKAGAKIQVPKKRLEAYKRLLKKSRVGKKVKIIGN